MFGHADRFRFSRSLLLQRMANNDVWLTEVLYRLREIKCSRGAKAWRSWKCVNFVPPFKIWGCKVYTNNLEISWFEKVAVGQGQVGEWGTVLANLRIEVDHRISSSGNDMMMIRVIVISGCLIMMVIKMIVRPTFSSTSTVATWQQSRRRRVSCWINSVDAIHDCWWFLF